MSHSRSARVSRLLLSFALVAAVAACGSGDSSSNRNRNVAIENEDGEDEEIDCDAQWDPTTGVMTLCQNFERVDVRQKGSNESNVSSSEGNTMTGNSLGITVGQGVTKLSLKLWTRNEGGQLREAGKVEFEANTAATKTFSFKPDAQEEVDRELVLGYESHEVTQTVAVTGLTRNSKAKFTVEYRLNGEAAEQNVLHAEMRALDAGGSQIGSASADIDPTRHTEDQSREWTKLNVELKGGFMASTASLVFVISGRDGASSSGGQTGPRITSATVKVGDKEISQNSEFDDGTDQWTVTDGSFAVCSETDGALPCITNAPFENAFEAAVTTESTVAPDTTIAADTTVAPDTTIAADTTLATDTTASTQSTIAPPLLVPRVECSISWSAESRTFTSCRDFKAIKVAVYGENGRYAGSASAENSDSVQLTDELAAQVKYVYYALGRELVTDRGTLVVSQAREWLTIPDRTQDVTDNFLMDSVENPSLREDGSPATFAVYPDEAEKEGDIRWELDRGIIDSDYVLEVNGVAGIGNATVPAASTYSVRLYASNEFGMLDYVAGTVTSVDDSTLSIDAALPQADALGLIQIDTETSQVAEFDSENFVEGNIDECKGASPILFTNPNSPSRTNRVTITLDSDCTSVNGVLAVAIVRNDWLETDSDFALSVAWWNVSSTRYSSRMTETIYLPDGKYSIYFFNPDTYFIKGIDYQIDSGGRNNACGEMSLRIDKEIGLAIVEGCDALANIDVSAQSLMPGNLDSNDESMQTEPDIQTAGAAIELQSVPSGWWRVAIMDRQQTVIGGVFALCVTSCDIAPGGTLAVDSGSLATDGKVLVEDSGCAELESRTEDVDNPYLYEELTAFLKIDADHAPRAAWLDVNFHDDDSLEMRAAFTAQFSRPGVTALLATACQVQGDRKTEEDPSAFTSRGLAEIAATTVPSTVPSNDGILNAVDITGASDVQIQQAGATLEDDEPLAGLSSFLFDRSLVTTTWFKFTPSSNSRVRLTIPDMGKDEFNPVTTGLTVYRSNQSGQMGFVTTNMSLAQLIWMAAMEELGDLESTLEDASAQEFDVIGGKTYYVQVVGLSFLRAPSTLRISTADEDTWSSQDTEAPDTTTGTDTTIVSDTTVVSDVTSTSTEVEVTTTSTEAVAVTTTPDTTVAPSTTPPAPDTTVGTDSPTTTAPGTAGQKITEGMLNLIENGSRNETTPVLAGSGTPTIETREDAQTVTISMPDLVASVSKSGAEINPQSRVFITTKTGRRIAVSQRVKSVTIPVAGFFGNQDIKVSAYDMKGKEVASQIVVKKSIAPLVKIKGGEDSGTRKVLALIALLLVAIVVYFVTRYARRSGAAA